MVCDIHHLLLVVMLLVESIVACVISENECGVMLRGAMKGVWGIPQIVRDS